MKKWESEEYAVNIRLDELIAESGIMRTEVARRAQIGRGTLSMITSLKRRVSIEEVANIMTAIGQPLSAAFGGKKWPCKCPHIKNGTANRRIAVMLASRGMTQLKLSELTGIGYYSINDIISAKRPVRADEAQRVAKAFGVKLADILRGMDE